MSQNDEIPTLDERLSSASNSSNLTLKPETRGPADLLIAAGRTPKVIGRHLIALYGEWDGQGRPRKPTRHAIERIAAELPRTAAGGLDMKAAHQTASNWYEAERLRLFGRLVSRKWLLSEDGKERGLALWAKEKGIDMPLQKVSDVLLWWLDRQCPICDGTKLEPLPVGGRGAVRACKPCQGTGERLLPHGTDGLRIEEKIGECIYTARQHIAGLHWGHQIRDAKRAIDIASKQV